MSLTNTEKIALDFYNKNITTVNAKQYDTESRYIEIVCTDHGKVIELNPDSMTAYIRYNKTDDNPVLDDTVITEDGTILVTLSQQMLACTGRQTVDVLITSLNGVSANQLVNINSIYEMGATIISTMPFYLNVIGSSLDESKIVSLPEYSALTSALTRLARTEKDMSDLENILEYNESVRQSNEEERQSGALGESYRQAEEALREEAEKERQTGEFGEEYRKANEILRQDDKTGEAYRIANEIKRQDDITGEAYRIANEIKRQDSETGEAYRIAEEIKRQNAESGRVTRMDEYIAGWDERLESIVDSTGLVLSEEKGIAGGVATLDENGYVPLSQLKHLPEIHIYNSLEEAEGKGKPGDLLLIPIKE